MMSEDLRVSKKLVLLVIFFAVTLFTLPAVADGTISHVSNEELKGLLDSDIVLVDIRRVEEWIETGVVEGSHTITLFGEDGRPMADFLPKLEKIASLDTPIIVICRTGNRTRVASEALTQQIGYSQVYNVTLGITDWIAKGHPVVKYQP